MINDDIEFLPQDSFFICMGDDGKPVFGRFESRPHYDGKFCAVVRYNQEVYRAGSESKQRAARMLIDHFFKINPHLVDNTHRLMRELADTLFEQKLHQLTYDFSPTPPDELFFRPYDWRDEYKLRPIEVNLRVVAEKQIEGGAVVESKCYRLTAYKQSKESGVQFYAEELK